MVNLKKKKTYIVIAIIFVFALLLRLVHLFLIKDNPLFLNLLLDAKEYDHWAKSILEKDWLSRDFDFMSPAYPYFLSLIYLIFGYNISAVALIQVLMGSANCVIIFLIAEKVFTNENNESRIKLTSKNINFIGVLASALAALYGISIFYECMLLKVALINFCNLVMLLMLIYGVEKSSYKYFVFAGIFLGISLFLRPNVLLFIPVIIFWLFTQHKKNGLKSTFTKITLFCVGVLLVSSLFWIRNYTLNHELVLTSGHSGMNFYLGNNPEGIYKPFDFCRPDTRFEHIDFVNEAKRLTGENLTTMQASNFWKHKAYEYILSHPFEWTGVTIKKFFIFWNEYEIPLNGLEYKSCREYFPFLHLPLLTFGIIAPLALLGLFLLLNKNQKINLLILYVLTYLVANVIILVYAETRFPVVPVLFIFASYALYFIIKLIKEKRIINLLISIITLSALIFLVNNKLFCIENNGFKAAQINNFGTIYANGKQFDNALIEFKKALFYSPINAEFIRNLANIYFEKGMLDSAVKEYKKVLAIKPDNDIHLRLAEIYLTESKNQNALAEYNEVLKTDSTSLLGLNGVGIVFANTKKYNIAEYWFKKALLIDSTFIPAIENYNHIKRLTGQVQNR